MICLEGKSMTPGRGNTILCSSSQQLPHHRLRPCLSWHDALQGPPNLDFEKSTEYNWVSDQTWLLLCLYLQRCHPPFKVTVWGVPPVAGVSVESALSIGQAGMARDTYQHEKQPICYIRNGYHKLKLEVKWLTFAFSWEKCDVINGDVAINTVISPHTFHHHL